MPMSAQKHECWTNWSLRTMGKLLVVWSSPIRCWLALREVTDSEKWQWLPLHKHETQIIAPVATSPHFPQYYSCDHLFQNKCKMLLSWSPPFKNRNTGLVYICFSNWGVILTLPAQSKKAFFTPEGHHPGPGPSWMWIASLATTEVYGYWVLSWCARMSLSCLEVLLSVKYSAILF